MRLEVPAEEIELLKIKDFIQRVCDAAGCTPKEANSLTLAVDEACTNIIRHAYTGKKDGEIELEAGIGLYDLRIKVIDHGEAFDFNSVKDPDLDHYVDIGKKGGLGIWLIKKVVDRVTYRAYGDRNEMVLYRKLSNAPPKELGLRKGSIPITAKFTIGSALLVTMLILSVFFFLSYKQASFIARQQTEKVNMIIETIASESGPAVIGKNDLELDRMIHRVISQDQFNILDYLFIIGEDGKFIAHSDLNQLFKIYHPPVGAKIVKTPGIRTFEVSTPRGSVTDYTSPIFFRGKWVGEAHTGVSVRAIDHLSSTVKSDFRRLIFFMFLISIIGLYFLSLIVIRPFRKILAGVHAVSTGNFNARINLESQDEFGQLANIFNDMTSRIQDSQKGMMEQERIQKEMQVAQEIQHTLLPAEFPQIEGYEIGATYRAAKEVGGDYYDFFWVDPTTLGIVVADVSGKGVPGSMVMTMIRTAMRLEARNNKSASNVLAKVNSHVTSDMKKGMFVTMFYIILDSRNRTINFASAGHNPMILYRGATKELYYLKPKGFPVGIDLPEKEMFENNMAPQKVSLQKNDILVIYTDGITEAMNLKKEQFGEARLNEVIKANAHLTPQEFVEKLNEAIAQFTKGAEQHDDITVVAIKEKMKTDNAVFNFRKKLLDLVKKDGLTVAEACRKMNISTQAYYRYLNIMRTKGNAGLKPVFPKNRIKLRELSQPQKEAVMEILKKDPLLSPKSISETLRKSKQPPMKVDPTLIYEYLKRKNLSNVKQRKAFALSEVDSV